MNTNKKKIKNQKGFTLIESLAALLTATIVTALFLILVNFAKDTYVDMQELSQGQILSSNLTNAIQDELRFASYIQTYDSDGHFTYYSQAVAKSEECKIVGAVASGSTKKRIYVQYGSGTSDLYALIGNDSYIFNLEADIDCRYDAVNQKFNCTLTISDGGATIITSTFVVDPLNKGTL